MNTQRLFVVISAALTLAASSTASAVTYNLNTIVTAPIDTVDGRAYFTTDILKTTGTGVINPFLSIQAGPTESGFNVSSGTLDTKRDGQYTRTQTVGDLQTITANGVSYYAFLIDINESNSAANSKISIDSIKIYTSNSLITTLSGLQTSATLQFDIDSLTDNTLLYNDLNTGSGQGDVAFFIPTSAFAGVASTDFFYLYQQFGGVGGAFDSDSGFEETRHGGDLVFVPVPETNALMPILAVLGVVVAGPFVRRCFHP